MSDENKKCDEGSEQTAPDPGAWPEQPLPGTPEALHAGLMKQHEDGGAQHPTKIDQPTEQRDRDRKP